MPPSISDSFTIESSVSQAYENELTDRLVEFNKAHSPQWEQNHDNQFTAAPLHLFIRDREGKLIGGLIGTTHSLRAWFEVSILWIDETYRGRGLGRKLMKQAEDEAYRRGCLYSRLSTSQYQASGFYEKLGYILYGKLENIPPGDTAFYYHKQLSPPK